MNKLKANSIEKWLKGYKKTWEESNIELIESLFSQNCVYSETPFGPHLLGIESIKKYWRDETKVWKDVEFEFDTIVGANNCYYTRWKTNLTRVSTNSQEIMIGVFYIELDNDGKAEKFEEFWHQHQGVLYDVKKSVNYDEQSVYLKGSNEAQITVDNLMSNIKPKLEKINKNKEFSVLDVGCSDGSFSLLLRSKIKEFLPRIKWNAIEPEIPAYKEFVKKIESEDIKYGNTTIQEFLLKNKKEKFDFILFSQCFYHFPKEEWNFIVEISRNLLKENGFIVIILDSHDCEAYALKDLITKGKAVTLEYGDLHSAEDIKEFLRQKEISFETFDFPIDLYIENNDKKIERLARHLAFLYRTYPEFILNNYENEVKEMLERNMVNDNYQIENRVNGLIFN